MAVVVDVAVVVVVVVVAAVAEAASLSHHVSRFHPFFKVLACHRKKLKENSFTLEIAKSE